VRWSFGDVEETWSGSATVKVLFAANGGWFELLPRHVHGPGLLRELLDAASKAAERAVFRELAIERVDHEDEDEDDDGADPRPPRAEDAVRPAPRRQELDVTAGARESYFEDFMRMNAACTVLSEPHFAVIAGPSSSRDFCRIFSLSAGGISLFWLFASFISLISA
jgi:hypothetical protein